MGDMKLSISQHTLAFYESTEARQRISLGSIATPLLCHRPVPLGRACLEVEDLNLIIGR